ncbi:MAG: type II toxin-antitoxin system PemK/MazF family toxin [Pseudomonadota bacterium]|nr:type II toxin-antitoxin system PemK/MazF family toxin [Gammaproteobacteria bacterium]
MLDIYRQEIWLVNLNPPGKGREIHKKRPALVVSVDDFNNCPAELVMILPITTTELKIPAHIRVKADEGGLTKKSFIKCDQIRTISKERLVKKLGCISDITMSKVESTLRILLDL